MDLQKRLFRKVALDRIASPERLDEMMEFTSPSGWLALIALGLALVGGVVWSVFGSIAIKVHGSGILIRGQAVRAVTAGSTGRLEELLIHSGDVVDQGDVVARVGRSDLKLRTPYSGRVLELGVNVGDMVAPGDRLLTLEALEGPIDAVVYIPAADGKKVKEGMEIRVSPSTVKAEEYGYIIGKVMNTSVFPVTPEGMKRVLSDLKLANSLTGEGAKIEVTASLIEDPTTKSGFRWTSYPGPPSEVYTGTICTASVIVEKKRPISYVLPILRWAAGMR